MGKSLLLSTSGVVTLTLHSSNLRLTGGMGGIRECRFMADGCLWGLAPQSGHYSDMRSLSIVCFRRTLGTAAPGHLPPLRTPRAHSDRDDGSGTAVNVRLSIKCL
jgi:hypothetical protein